jgi:preprotein translocase subunit SecY
LLSAFVNAFRTPDLRKKILFTIFIVGIYRLGANLPSPGVSYDRVQACVQAFQDQDSGGLGVFTLLNLFSGGALLQLSVFALGIMPYITASIIMQLLRVVIPRLELLHKEGQSGQAKMTQYTRYLTLGLAVLQSSAFVALARSGQLFGGVQCDNVIPSRIDTAIADWIVVGTLVITMTAGTGVIMWLGELITDRGIGNGMSTLIFCSIAAQLPTEGWRIRQNEGVGNFIILLGIAVLIITAVIFMELGQRRIPVQYAKRVVGRRIYGGQSTYLPLRVNTGGVIPVIFASSVVMVPTTIASMIQNEWVQRIADTVAWGQPLYYVLYITAIVFFCYFYVSIIFNPADLAENMRKYGGFIPGIRPGKRTAEYIDRILTRITLVGAVYLAAVSVLPDFLLNGFKVSGIPGIGDTLDLYAPNWFTQGLGIQFYFGGTSLLIVVGVAMDTIQQVESQLVMRNYEGFMKRGRIRGRRG